MTEEVRGSREEELERIRQVEASPEYQQKLSILREKMTINLKWKTYLIPIAAVGVVLVILLKFVGILITAVLGFVFLYPLYKKKQELFGSKKQNNEALYIEEFLSPIVKEIFPGGEMKVKPDFLLDPVKQVCPSSTNYRGNTELCLRDAKDISVMNLYAYHIVESTDSKGRTTRREVTDFAGQVFRMRFANPFTGHIRVIPTKKSVLLKREVQDYPNKQKNELKIDTEDITHNENYNIFCTDEFSARRFLNPTVLDWFDKNISQSQTAIYIEDDTMYISRYTGYYLFPVPNTMEAVEKLSMVEEYKKLRAEIDFIESFTEIFS